MKDNILRINLIEDLLDIKKSALHQTWNIEITHNQNIILTGKIHEISSTEIIELLVKHYPTIHIIFNLESKHILLY